jgi:hypothetical protein
MFCSSFVTEFNQPAVGHNDFYCIHLFVALLTSDPVSDETFKYLTETIMIYGPTQDNDGTWMIKTNEELEILIKKIS